MNNIVKCVNSMYFEVSKCSYSSINRYVYNFMMSRLLDIHITPVRLTVNCIFEDLRVVWLYAWTFIKNLIWDRWFKKTFFLLIKYLSRYWELTVSFLNMIVLQCLQTWQHTVKLSSGISIFHTTPIVCFVGFYRLTELRWCLKDINNWINCNFLLLNPGTTEVIMTLHRHPAPLRNPEVIFDQDFSCSSHIK